MGWLETADRKEEGLNAADIDRRRSVVEHRDISGKRKEGNFGKAVADWQHCWAAAVVGGT